VNQLQFEWDARKAAVNLRQHEVSFEEAKSVFLDEEALLIPDEEHSTEEDRFIIMGFSMQLRILVVCHCYRHRAMSFASSLRERQAERRDINTSNGEQHEKELRLFKSGEKPVRETAEAAANH